MFLDIAEVKRGYIRRKGKRNGSGGDGKWDFCKRPIFQSDVIAAFDRLVFL